MVNNDIIKELQTLESHLQGFLMQKQSLQIELNQIENALEELNNTDDEVYKIVSGIMIKSDKKLLEKELEEKKEVLDGKIEVMEKQEELLEKKSSDLRKELGEKNEKE